MLSKGSFFPSILEPRRRIDRAYGHGASTRKVDDLVAALRGRPGRTSKS